MAMTTWKPTDLAYFAGIVDGEGCFSLRSDSRHPRPVYSCFFNVTNTDPRLAQWIQDRFGGKIVQEPVRSSRWKRVYRWHASTTDMDTLIPALLPYLLLKKDRAELLLAYRRTIIPRGKKKRTKGVTLISEAEKLHRREIFDSMALLNKVGEQQIQ